MTFFCYFFHFPWNFLPLKGVVTSVFPLSLPSKARIPFQVGVGQDRSSFYSWCLDQTSSLPSLILHNEANRLTYLQIIKFASSFLNSLESTDHPSSASASIFVLIEGGFAILEFRSVRLFIDYFCMSDTMHFTCQASLEKQNWERERVRDIEGERFMAYTIIEANKSPNLQLGSWRPRRTDGIVPVQVRRSENKESW